MSQRAWLVAFLSLLGSCSSSPGSLAPDLGLADRAPPPERIGDEAGVAGRLLGEDRDAYFDELVTAIEGVQVISTKGLARLGLSWPEALAPARARFRSARSAADVYYALLALQRSFHDAHSRFELAPGEVAPPATPAVSLPFTLRAELPASGAGPTEYVVVAVEPAASVAIPVGSRLVAVDGRAPAELERELVTWLQGSSPDALRESVARWLVRRHPAELPSPAPGATVQLRFLAPKDGSSYERPLAWREAKAGGASDPCLAGLGAFYPPSDEYAARKPEHIGLNLCVYPGGDAKTRVVRWFGFLYEYADVSGGDPAMQGLPALRSRLKHTSFTIPEHELPFLPGEQPPGGRIDAIALSSIELDRLFAALGAAGVSRMLVDVRENGGGNFDPSWISPYTAAPFKQLATEVHFRPGLRARPELLAQAEGGPQVALAMAYLLAHPSAEKSPLYPFICRSQSCSPDEIVVPGAPQPFPAALVVLAGPGCVSSCDNYVSLLRDNGLAKLAGLSPRGADSPVRLPLAFALKNGQGFRYVLTVAVNLRPGSEVLEGNPPAPDFPVPPTAANRGTYLEAVLSSILWP